jgi:hypothetical protein
VYPQLERGCVKSKDFGSCDFFRIELTVAKDSQTFVAIDFAANLALIVEFALAENTTGRAQVFLEWA